MWGTTAADYNRPPKDVSFCHSIFELILIPMCLPPPVVKLNSDCIIAKSSNEWTSRLTHFIHRLKLECFDTLEWVFLISFCGILFRGRWNNCLYCSLIRLASEPLSDPCSGGMPNLMLLRLLLYCGRSLIVDNIRYNIKCIHSKLLLLQVILIRW